jgi:hypothetical protein
MRRQSMVRWYDGRYAVSVEPGQQGRVADLHYECSKRGSVAAVCAAGRPDGDRVVGLACGATAVYVGRTPGVEEEALRASVGADAFVDVADPYWLVALPVGQGGVVGLSASVEVDLAVVSLRRLPDPPEPVDDDPEGWSWMS